MRIKLLAKDNVTLLFLLCPDQILSGSLFFYVHKQKSEYNSVQGCITPLSLTRYRISYIDSCLRLTNILSHE